MSIELVDNQVAPVLPRSFHRADLEAAGFAGWERWHQLRATDFGSVPYGPAAYVIYRSSSQKPVFLAASVGGHFKGRDPTVATTVLTAKWVAGAQVLYIGKADAARSRLRQYARFGSGEPVGHWGGRYIWQLVDSGSLVVAWHEIHWQGSARDYEKRLLARFTELHGARPFANLVG